MATPLQQKIRRTVWTGAISSVVFVGTIYGAGLKTRQENKTMKQQVEETLDVRLAQLEEQRGVLVGKRLALERKMHEIEAKTKGDETPGKGQERRLN